jgi:hypothetical protein
MSESGHFRTSTAVHTRVSLAGTPRTPWVIQYEDWYYFARRKETSALPPAEETGVIQVSVSSVSTVIGRV